jgi:cytochrome P450 family 135
MRECLSRYGPAFTIQLAGEGPCVYLAEPEDVRRVFTAAPADALAGAVNVQLEPLLGARSILLLDGNAHLSRRRLMLPPFHGDRVARWAAAIEEIAAADVERWPVGRPLTLLPRMRAITLEAIVRIVLGADGDTPNARRLRRALVCWLAIAASPLALVPALRRGGRRSPWGKFLRARREVQALIDAHLARLRADPDSDQREDVACLLLRARTHDGTPLELAEVRDQLTTLLVAGHETTATALAWAFACLVRAPEPLAAAIAEARAGLDGPMTAAVAQETLRLHPPIPVVGRSLAVRMRVAGHELPAGSVMVPCIWLIHRRADLYPSPDQFRPERFLDAAPATYEWLPFGGGVRRCLGASFALLEMRTVLRAVLARVELAPARPRMEGARWRAIVLAPNRGGRVVVRQRG